MDRHKESGDRKGTRHNVPLRVRIQKVLIEGNVAAIVEEARKLADELPARVMVYQALSDLTLTVVSLRWRMESKEIAGGKIAEILPLLYYHAAHEPGLESVRQWLEAAVQLMSQQPTAIENLASFLRSVTAFCYWRLSHS